MDLLTELQQDALTEAFNIGMGVAAASLSEMVSEEVKLSVPEIEFVSREQAAKTLNDRCSSQLTGVSQRFTGAYDGEAMLLFPADKSLELVRLMLRDTVPLTQLTEFEEEALNEIGNIILNAGLGSLADMFGEEITSMLPVFKHGSCANVLSASGELIDSIVLFLRVDFKLETHELDGYLVLMQDINSVKGLAKQIDRFLEKLG